MPRTLWLPVLLVLAFVGQAAAAEATFLTPGHPDLTKLLPAPPAPSSKEQYGDLAGILADVLGSSFTAERLPRSRRCSKRFAAMRWSSPMPEKIPGTGRGPTMSAPRSNRSVRSRRAAPIRAPAPSSGISRRSCSPTWCRKRARRCSRGREFGDDRVILGVHFPTDIEAGRLAATAIAAALLENVALQTEFAAAKAELRQTLGL
jgi:acid phosphatase (class A)